MPNLSIAALLEELADEEEAGVHLSPHGRRAYRQFQGFPEGSTGSVAERVLLTLKEAGWKARELALFELRLESKGTAEALRATAAEQRSFRQRREVLLQGVVYPVFLSLFLSVALALLQLSYLSGDFSLPGEEPTLSPILIPLLLGSALLVAAALPLLVLLATRKRELPGRLELLLLLREALHLSPSLAASLRRVRRALAAWGLRWEPLAAAEGHLEEGVSPPRALKTLLPPLTEEDLRLIETHPARGAASALITSLIRHGELKERRRHEREAQLLPAAALLLIGVELLLAGLLVVLPLMENLILLG